MPATIHDCLSSVRGVLFGGKAVASIPFFGLDKTSFRSRDGPEGSHVVCLEKRPKTSVVSAWGLNLSIETHLFPASSKR